MLLLIHTQRVGFIPSSSGCGSGLVESQPRVGGGDGEPDRKALRPSGPVTGDPPPHRSGGDRLSRERNSIGPKLKEGSGGTPYVTSKKVQQKVIMENLFVMIT